LSFLGCLKSDVQLEEQAEQFIQVIAQVIK
jgi:hypothetical protein